MFEKPFRVLFIKLAALGDVVMASCAVAAARSKYQNVHITWLCGAETYEFVKLIKGVDEILVIDNSLLSKGFLSKICFVFSAWKKLFFKRFDLVVTAHSDRRYKLLSLFAVGKKLYFSRKNLIFGRYHGNEYARLVLEHNNSFEDDYPLADFDYVKNDNAKGMILLVPGGAKNAMNEQRLKRWNSYRQLAELFILKGYSVGILGSSVDKWTEEIFKDIQITSFVGKTSIKELIEIISGASILITHDTGTLHIGYLTDIPVIALFGPTAPSMFTPRSKRVSVLFKQLSCSPCYNGVDFADCNDNICMKKITADEVFSEAEKLLDKGELQ